MNDSPKFIQWKASSWQDAVELTRQMNNWLYRGQESLSWGLETSLERIAQIYNSPGIARKEQEEEIINKFKRQAHQYLTHLPDPKDNLEWLSLIQHHGGPTRLLDFTRSFYVGIFFALENATGQAVLWAINQSVLDGKLAEICELFEESRQAQTIRSTAKGVVEYCLKKTLNQTESNREGDIHRRLSRPNVIAVKPWRLNQRMIIQQGWFLFPTDLETTFEHNLCSAFGIPDLKLPPKQAYSNLDELKELVKNPESDLALLKIILPRKIHLEAMCDLQQMNITAATLFPGLDGFARSLKLPLRRFDGLERGINETIP